MSTPADYWAQAQIDPSYQATKGGLTKSLIQQILGYGDSSALAPEEASLYGITPNQTAAADQNPYSTVHQLAQQLSSNQYGIGNAANSRGLSDSGALVAAQGHENQQGAQRSYNALQALQQQISGIDAKNTQGLTDAYGAIATNAANTPTVPTVDPNQAANNAAAFQAGSQVPQPIQNIGPSNFTGDARTGTSLYAPITAPKPPKPLTPKISLGHV
jgi:hypothetical protein